MLDWQVLGKLEMAIAAILTDIEGTTTDISFVHDQLFPYSIQMLPTYLRSQADKPEIAALLSEIRQLAQCPEGDLETIIDILCQWIAADRKITPLKALQGYIWEFGYQSGELQGHIYPDAGEYLQKWHDSGRQLYVYSSGSIKAQKLLFGHSNLGDITPLFSGYFDTTTGSKKESKSYQKISQKTAINPASFLFISDVAAELEAAEMAGLKTMMLVRDETVQTTAFPVARNFSEVNQYWQLYRTPA